eukprot:TRINITY_DN10686_c0_g1_i1.p1 TRINITY_DN10686_c0_g1~~TRINITY_DN10686_c0_g1_i1.p1  ORF type:complete len:329 (-),score=102.46 TRINITY_DN10686_c0_g1_i1:42-959(-)
MSVSLPSSPVAGRKHHRNRAEWMLDQARPPARMTAANQMQLPQRAEPPVLSFRPTINDGVPDFAKQHARITRKMEQAHRQAETQRTSTAEFKFRSLERSSSVSNPVFEESSHSVVPLARASSMLSARGLPALSKRSVTPGKLDTSDLDWSTTQRWAESLRVYSGPASTVPLLLSADDEPADLVCARTRLPPPSRSRSMESIRSLRKSNSVGSGISSLSRSGTLSSTLRAAHLESDADEDDSDESADEALRSPRRKPQRHEAAADRDDDAGRTVAEASAQLQQQFGGDGGEQESQADDVDDTEDTG